MFRRLSHLFRPHSGGRQFFASILIWGVAAGCFTAVLNNYLADVRHINEFERGVLEFFREMPGLLLVFIIAAMHRFTDWKILKIGTLISMAGVAGLMLSADKILITALVMVWSTGEHILMPVRSSIAMRIARHGKLGRSLGLVTGSMNAGSVVGSLIAAAVFYCGTRYFQVANPILLYNFVWGGIVLLLIVSVATILLAPAGEGDAIRRPRLHYHPKYHKYYALELFSGARKQIFLTFAPYVLILNYHMTTTGMAMLVGVAALLNIFCAPLIGRMMDRIGYKSIIFYNTVVLFFVCILYGYADSLFTRNIAYYAVCVNYLLDAVISTIAMANNVYAREISDTREETTASLTTGISINHLISIIAALVGGLIWQKFGVGVLFSFAAIMALANGAFALTIPAPGAHRKTR